MLKAACFDLDGTLVDTGPLHVEAEHRTLRSLGLPGPAADHPVTFGTGVLPGIQILANHYGLGSAERVLEVYLAEWETVFESGLEPLPGADSALRNLYDAGVPLALVTSGEKAYVDRVLPRFGWSGLFGPVVTLESVTKLKPDPGPYLLAASELGHSKAECMGFEDSASGLLALQAAGMFAVGVGERAAGARKTEHPDLALLSLAEVDAEFISHHFGL